MTANFVVIPVRDNPAMTGWLLGQLEAQRGYDAVFVFDNGSQPETAAWLAGIAGRYGMSVLDAAGLSLIDMWRAGTALARSHDRTGNIAFLNNDVSMGADFLPRLSDALASDAALWAVSPNYDGRAIDGVELVTSTYKRKGLAGFAFMVKGAAFEEVDFDRAYEWWFGDDDLVAQIEARGGKIGVVGDVSVEHVRGGSQTVRYTADVVAALERDRQRMICKWGHD